MGAGQAFGGPEDVRGGKKRRKMARNGLEWAENRGFSKENGKFAPAMPILGRKKRKSRVSGQKTCATGLIFAPAGESGGLADPAGQAGVVGRVALVDIEIAHVGILGRAGRRRAQVGAAEEGDFDVARQAMESKEPALAGDAVEERVPPHGLDRAARRGEVFLGLDRAMAFLRRKLPPKGEGRERGRNIQWSIFNHQCSIS